MSEEWRNDSAHRDVRKALALYEAERRKAAGSGLDLALWLFVFGAAAFALARFGVAAVGAWLGN